MFIGILVSVIVGIFLLCCLCSCVSNYLDKRRRRKRRSGLRRYNLEFGAGYHQQRTAALEQRQQGHQGRGAVDAEGENIYMIDTR